MTNEEFYKDFIGWAKEKYISMGCVLNEKIPPKIKSYQCGDIFLNGWGLYEIKYTDFLEQKK